MLMRLRRPDNLVDHAAAVSSAPSKILKKFDDDRAAHLTGHGVILANVKSRGSAESPPTRRNAMSPLDLDRIALRVRREFQEMPGLQISFSQMTRLCGLEPSICRAVV